MELKLHLVPVPSIPLNYIFIHPYRSPRSVRFPNLYFSGTSLGLCGNVEVPVHGTVNMGDDGVVRWRFVSWVSSHLLLCQKYTADFKLLRYLFVTAFRSGALKAYKLAMLEVRLVLLVHGRKLHMIKVNF